MANKVLLVNPSKRPSQRKKTRSAAQKRATAKLVRLNKQRAAEKRRKNPAAKRKTTGSKTMAAKKRRTAAQKAATRKLVAFNKRRAKGGSTTKRKAPARRRSTAPARRRRSAAPAMRRRRRNPIRRAGFLQTTVFPALTAGAGALALDIAWANLPIPATLKMGPFKHVAKAAGAIGLSMLAGQVIKKKTAEQLGMGALTVVVHNAAREILATAAPNLKMDGMGYYGPGFDAGSMAMYVPPAPGMGMYTPPVNGMGNAHNYNPESGGYYE